MRHFHGQHIHANAFLESVACIVVIRCNAVCSLYRLGNASGLNRESLLFSRGHFAGCYIIGN